MNRLSLKNLPADFFLEPLAISGCKTCQGYIFETKEDQDEEHCKDCRKTLRDLNIIANEDIYRANIKKENEGVQEQLEKELELNLEKVRCKLQMRYHRRQYRVHQRKHAEAKFKKLTARSDRELARDGKSKNEEEL